MKLLLYTTPSLKQCFLLCCLAVCATGVFAQSATLSVQGVLTKSDGTAVDDDTYTMTFRLWNDPSATGGANKKYEETIANVETTGGVYSVVLGAASQPLDAQFNEVYYLGVSMNTSSVELLPRPRLTHAPYALGIKGQNNTFPSVGGVIGDAFRAKGGPASGGPNGNGFAFQAPSGDDIGGMFSDGANNLNLFAGGNHRIKLTNGLTELLGQTNAADLTVNGTLKSNALNPLTANGTVTVNGSETVTGNEQINGNTLTLGNTQTNGKFLTHFATDGGGYSFDADGAYDSGLFGLQDGDVELRSNGGSRVLIGINGTNYINGTTIYQSGGFIEIKPKLFLKTVQDFDGKNMQWNSSTGEVGADNSTRRAKFNIKPLEDDFKLILKAQPKTYTRKVDPNHWEVGYIAEEMDSLGLKKLVEYDKDGRPDGYNYEKMILYVTEVLKLQQADIEKLQAEVAVLKVENNGLRTENSTLRSDNGSLQQLQTSFGAQLEALGKRLQSLESTGNSRK